MNEEIEKVEDLEVVKPKRRKKKVKVKQMTSKEQYQENIRIYVEKRKEYFKKLMEEKNK